MEGKSLTEDEMEAKFNALKEEFFQDLEIKLGKSPKIKSIENQLSNFRVKVEEITPAIQVWIFYNWTDACHVCMGKIQRVFLILT